MCRGSARPARRTAGRLAAEMVEKIRRAIAEFDKNGKLKNLLEKWKGY